MNAPGVKGISRVNTGIGVWGESTGMLGHAGYFTAPGGTGLYVGEAGVDGIYILQAGDEGLEIHDAGNASSHLYPPDLEFGNTRDGISIGGARDFGVWVGFAGRTGVGVARTNGYGYWVGEAGADGIRVEFTRQSGLSIARAELAGIHISHAGTSGLVVDKANLFGVHVSSQGAAGVHAESVRGPGGEFSSEESHALVVDGPALIGGRTPEQIGMLKWYEASDMLNVVNTKSGPSGLAFDGQHIWVGHQNTWEVLQLRASNGYTEETFGSNGCDIGPIHDGLRLWSVRQADGWFDLLGYNKEGYDSLIHAEVDPGGTATSIAFDGSHVWVGADNGVYRFTITDESLAHLPSGISGSYETDWGIIKGAMFTLHRYNVTCSALAFDGTYMWIANWGIDKVIKLHANTMQDVGTIAVGNEPIALAFDGANMWVANYGDGTVTKLRTSDGHTLGTYQVGKKPRALVFDGFHIWVANEGDDTLTKLRASDGALVGTYKTGRSPRALVFDGTHVWVANYLDDTLMKF
ncbi:YncE family protein [Candidatus Bipolaricaulota bacterium]